MALKTKQAIVDEIAYELYGGLPSNDRAVSDNFIVRKLNNKIAESAVKSAFGTYNLDGVVEADDIFRLTYSNLTLSTDADGIKYFALPAQPVGIPSQRSIHVYPPAMRGGRQSSIFKMIPSSQVTKVRSLPPVKKVFCFVENGNVKFIDSFQIMATYSTVNLSIISSGANDLTAFLNMPDDMINQIKAEILQDLRPMISLRDTDPLPPQDSPQPRGGV